VFQAAVVCASVFAVSVTVTVSPCQSSPLQLLTNFGTYFDTREGSRAHWVAPRERTLAPNVVVAMDEVALLCRSIGFGGY